MHRSLAGGDVGGNAGEEVGERDRLDQHRVCTLGQEILGREIRADHDDGERGGVRATQAGKHLVPTHPWEQQIEQDERRRACGDRAEGARAIHSDLYPVAGVAEDSSKQTGNHVIGIHEQDGGGAGHGRSLPRCGI